MKKRLLLSLTFPTLLACAHTQSAGAGNDSNDKAKDKNSATLASAPVKMPEGAACAADDQCNA